VTQPNDPRSQDKADPESGAEFFVGFNALPRADRRFLIKAIPAGVLGLAMTGGFLGARAASSGGGRWETGTPVTLQGRIGFHPYPILWVEGQGIVLAGLGKVGADSVARAFDGQTVDVTGIRIVRGDCYMLGVAAGNIKPVTRDLPPLPEPSLSQTASSGPAAPVTLMGEIVDAQCFMGIMNPGYGRTHRACATLCIRGGQPVYFVPGRSGAPTSATPPVTTSASLACGDIGFLLATEDGAKINADILDVIARPLTLTGQLETVGSLSRLRLTPGSIKLL